jgi:hypothetical protein
MCQCLFIRTKTKSQYKDGQQILQKWRKVQIFGNDSRKSKLHSCSKEHIKLGEYLYDSVQNLLSSRLLPKTQRLKFRELQICLLMCMGAKLGLSH